MKTFLLTLLLATTAFGQVSRTIDADRFKRVTGVPGAIITLPNYAGSLSTLDGVEIFTNKTMLSPIISGPTITGGSVSATVIDNATLTGGSISSMIISDSTIIGGTSSGVAILNPIITGGSISGTTIAGGTFNGTVSGATIVSSIIDGALNFISNISLTSSVSGVLPIANGGTNNGDLSVVSGSVLYTDGSKIVTNTPAVSSGQILVASGTVPVWVNQYSVSAIAALNIDWSLANSFTKTLSANTTFTFSNLGLLGNGQTIVVRLTNTASNYTVTWPTVRWATGAAPVMTVGAKSDVYTFFYDGVNIYGSVVQDMY